MVAPNGARKTKKDNKALPMTISELVKTASACYKFGANAIHAHVRDDAGKHVLDAGLYKELIVELERAVPNMEVQITTEAAGHYSPAEQRELVEQVSPKAVSVALNEMLSDEDERAQKHFYWQASEADIDLQHILYSPEQIMKLAKLVNEGFIPTKKLSMLFVIGRYTKGQVSSPDDLLPFIEAYENSTLKESSKFMVCAFGQNELACLLAAAKAGGDCRVGFENNHLLPDGNLAKDNASQVSALVMALKASR